MMPSTEVRPRIALTLGDPAGIGPELAAKLLAKPETTRQAEVYVLADKAELDAAATLAGVDVPLCDEPEPGCAVLLDDNSAPKKSIPVQQVSREAGERAMHQLRRAVALADEGKVEAILFTPINKTSLKLGGMNEEDELRWLAKALRCKATTSELNVLPGGFWTARVTSHVPVSEIAKGIKAPDVKAMIRLLQDALSDSGLESPRLAVCGLNPHAGENGNFGREEIDEITPGIEAAVAEGIDVSGPFSSDTVFLAANRGDFDGVVTMYHDQGQIAVKMIGFDRGVTIHGGLPIAIVTPAHGTAFDIVGKNIANLGATQHAFELAVTMGSKIRAATDVE
jgi:4-hydroxythreonine-4-phosphate dehydrogenase